MADVDTWSPLDESNISPPPDGWPEFMLPSGVNNSARAMMGAIRRWYDKTLSGELVLPYLKLSGGSVTGAVTVSAAFTATAITSNTTIYSASTISTGGALSAAGNITGANVTASNTVTAQQLTSNGNINAAGSIWCWDLHSAGSINTNNTISAVGTVQGGYVTSTGNVNAASSVTAQYVSASQNVSASGQISSNTMIANGINSNGNLGVAGQTTTGPFYAAGSYGIGNWKFYVTDEIRCARHIIPITQFGVYCGVTGFSWAGVFSLGFSTVSGRAMERDVAPLPPRCLDLVNAIEPKTYRLDLELSDTVDQQERDRTRWGFLAPEVSEAMQRAGVKFDGVKLEEDRASLDYNEMICVLWGAVRELSARVESLTR
jgi:hypothetical protein